MIKIILSMIKKKLFNLIKKKQIIKILKIKIKFLKSNNKNNYNKIIQLKNLIYFKKINKIQNKIYIRMIKNLHILKLIIKLKIKIKLYFKI